MMKKVNRNNGAIDVTTVGGRIKKLRTDAGFTQEELAIELHLEGKSAISSYETNSRGVSAEMLTQLSRLLHIAKLNGRICGAKRSHSVFEQSNCYQSV